MPKGQAKYFNVTGICVPDENYMVDTSAKIERIVRDYIVRGEYFTINRARQFGKTTTLVLLEKRLADEYLVVRLSFEGRDSYFESFERFVDNVRDDMARALKEAGNESLAKLWEGEPDLSKPEQYLRRCITETCALARKPVVLLIDEVDRASDFGVFSAFLGLLREMYLERKAVRSLTFQSVILAGVHDIKNLRKKMQADSEHSYNSPWNIAADFKVDLSFSAPEIKTMLVDYENDHATGMDTTAIAKRIFYYTNGYPFLVSRLCKTIDEQPLAWDVHGVDEAERLLLWDQNTLFDDMFKNILNNESFANLLQDMLFRALEISFDPEVPDINLGAVYGILVDKNGKAAISNIIFETRITNFFLTMREQEMALQSPVPENSLFIQNGQLDMDAVISRFSAFMYQEYRDEDGSFIERQARLLFLSFLKAIINGSGNYAVEPQTRGNRRMDIVVFFAGREYIIELKIWKGESYELAGLEQLARYLSSRGQQEGWLVSFCDLKKSPRKSGTVEIDGLVLKETVLAYRDER